MNLSDLKASGGFVSRETVPTVIKWRKAGPDGEFEPCDYTVHIVQPSYGDIETIAVEGKGQRHAVQVATVAACVRLGEKGEVRLTYEQAFDLHPLLLLELHAAIDRAGVVPKKQSPSPETPKSGMSLSSPE